MFIQQCLPNLLQRNLTKRIMMERKGGGGGGLSQISKDKQEV